MAGGQKAPTLSDPCEIELWDKILSHQNEQFHTSGRGSRAGVEFTYSIRGAELFVDRRNKSITRSTIMYAFEKRAMR